MAVKVDAEKCTGCGSCVDACPAEALAVESELVVVDADACIDCGACIDECPTEALEME